MNIPKIPRSRYSSPHIVTNRRIRTAMKALRLVADAMDHIGHGDKAKEARGAVAMLEAWHDGVNVEMLRRIGFSEEEIGRIEEGK